MENSLFLPISPPLVNESEIIFSAVGTPPDEDGSADLKYVLDVAKTVGRSMKKTFGLCGKEHRSGWNI